MTLVISTLSAAILAAMNKQAAKTDPSDSPVVAQQEFADDLATAIDAYIKTGTVNTTVTGTSATGGPVAGTGSGAVT